MGLDFQGLLQPIFEECVLQLFSNQLTVALESFNNRLEGHKWVPLPAPALSRNRAAAAQARATAAAEEGAGSGGGATEEGGAGGTGRTDGVGGRLDEDLAPPYVLMEHVPLALFCNALLSAFNELRHCALLSICSPLAGYELGYHGAQHKTQHNLSTAEQAQ